MKVQIPQLVYDKVMHWVNKADFEVSGFGTVKYDAATHAFIIVDAYLLKQEGGAAHTDIDASALGKLMYDTRSDEGDLKWWWHSHVKMSVFWSSTDTDTIHSLGKEGWAVATVFNQKNEMKSAICYKSKSDFNDLIHTDHDLPTEITKTLPAAEVVSQWDESFTTHVTEKKWQPQTYIGGSYHTRDPYDYSEYYEHGDARDWWTKYKEAQARKESADKNKDADTLQVEVLEAGLAKDDRPMNFEPGLMGYGIKAEAKALGIKVPTYRQIIETENTGKIIVLEDRLDGLIRSGRLV